MKRNLQKLKPCVFLTMFLELILCSAAVDRPEVFGRDGTARSVGDFSVVSKDKDIDSEIDLTKPLKRCWDLTGSRIESDKTASDNVLGKERVYIPYFDGKIAAVDLSDTAPTKKLWETDLGGKIIAAPLVSAKDKNIYILSEKKDLENPKDRNENKGNTEKQKSNTKNSQTRLIVRSLNKESGLTEWQADFDSRKFDESQPPAAEINREDATKDVNENNEKQESERENNNNDEKENENESKNPIVAATDSDIFIIYRTGSVFSLKKSDGQLRWHQNYRTSLSKKSLLVGDRLVLSGTNGILVVSTDNGSISEFIELTAEPSALFYQDGNKGGNKNGNGRLIFGDSKGTVSSLSFWGGIKSDSAAEKPRREPKLPAWRFRNGAGVSDIDLTAEGFLIASLDNFLYMLSEANGEIIWKKRLAGRITDNPLIKDRYAVVTNAAEPVASVLDLQNGKTLNKIILENGDFFTGKPSLVKNKLLLFTQRGIFVFSDRNCI